MQRPMHTVPKVSYSPKSPWGKFQPGRHWHTGNWEQGGPWGESRLWDTGHEVSAFFSTKASWSLSFMHLRASKTQRDRWYHFIFFNFWEKERGRVMTTPPLPQVQWKPGPSWGPTWGSETLPPCITSSHPPEWKGVLGVWGECCRGSRFYQLWAQTQSTGTCLWISNIPYLPKSVKVTAGRGIGCKK